MNISSVSNEHNNNDENKSLSVPETEPEIYNKNINRNSSFDDK